MKILSMLLFVISSFAIAGSPSFKADRTKTVMTPTPANVPTTVGATLTYAPTGADIKLMTNPTVNSDIVYSRYTPISIDNAYLMIHGENSTSMHVIKMSDQTTVRDFPALGEVNEFRWHYGSDFPHRLYYVTKMQFRMVDVDTGVDTLIRDFQEFAAGLTFPHIQNDVEGDSSNDSRYWAWQVLDWVNSGAYPTVRIFVYDRVNNSILGNVTPAQWGGWHRPNMVEMCPHAECVLVHWNRAYPGSGYEDDAGTHRDGPHVYNLNLDVASAMWITPSPTHGAWAMLADGTDVLVDQNDRTDWLEAHRTNVPYNPDGSASIRIYNHAELGYANLHFSKNYSIKGWTAISTYMPSANWSDNQILAFPIEANATVMRITPTMNTYPGNEGYRNEAPAAQSFDGNTFAWHSNAVNGSGVRRVLTTTLPVGWQGGVTPPQCTNAQPTLPPACADGQLPTGGTWSRSAYPACAWTYNNGNCPAPVQRPIRCSVWTFAAPKANTVPYKPDVVCSAPYTVQ